MEEVDHALGALQTTRQILGELQSAERLLYLGETKTTQEQERPAGLRYSGMRVEEVARALSLSEEHIRRLLRRRELEGIAYGGRVGWRLDRDYVMGLVAAREARRD